MLANPRYSRLVLINPSRGETGKFSVEVAARWRDSLSLLPSALNIFGVGTHVAGEYDPGRLPENLAETVTVLDVDGLSLWQDQQFTAHLAASNIGVIFLGGAWLEEQVLIAALVGIGLGYDVRVLVDLTRAREEGDRKITLDRLALHGVLSTTVRQAFLEWAVRSDDPALKQKVQQLLP